MNNGKKKCKTGESVKRAIFACAAAVCVLLPADLLLTGLNTEMRCREFLLFAAAVWALCLFLPQKRGARRAVFTILGAEALVCFACLLLWKNFSSGAVYEETDTAAKEMFAGKRVMIFVPHEDDDINLCGGIIEEYTSAGSEVITVFSTNGDYTGEGERRIREAIACMKLCGVPEEQVIFLGYGDQWSEGTGHLYNAEEGKVMTSYTGRRETYGTAEHPAYSDGKPYTAEGFIEDIRKAITEYMPDVLFCVEREEHGDHAALSLGFEKALGEVLKEQSDYHPQVLKGFAYDTAFFAEKDFYAVNMLSTGQPERECFREEDSPYSWEARVRLPVKANLLSRSMYSSGIYRELKEYASQNAKAYAESIINGDKVFWQRRTDSLLYDAEIRATSGDARVLNDFMLTDDRNIADGLGNGADGTWLPDAEDSEKTISIRLPEERDVTEIWLYDNPEKESNILRARIVFDNGEECVTGPLQRHGAATKISTGRQRTESFEILIEESEGNNAGLTEAEAYGPETEAFSFIKLMDEDGNFAYDWATEEKAVFRIYRAGKAADTDEDGYSVTCSNGKCSAEMREGRIEVSVPRGETCVLTVQDGSGEYTDSIVLHGIRGVRGWQYAERRFRKLFLYQIPQTIKTEILPALVKAE